MIELTEEQRRELRVPEPVAIDREHEQDLRPGAKERIRSHQSRADRVATVDCKRGFQPAERTTPPLSRVA